MTKSIKDSIDMMIGLIFDADTDEFTDGTKQRYDNTLKELEAIIKAAKPPTIDTPSRVKLYADDEGQMWYDRGQNDTIKRYEANLLTALYGKESK